MPQTSNIGRFGYTGQAWLPELGLWYYKARMYAPGLGRFLQTDPIGYAGGMNLYAYAGVDPINYTDPGGLAKNCVTIPGSSVLVGDSQTVTATRTYCQNGSDVYRGPSGFPSGGGGGSGGIGTPVAPGTGSTPDEMMAQARLNGDRAAFHNSGSVIDLFWFRNQVRNGGPWDYKQYSKDNPTGYQAFGNYNYGYTGAAAGYSLDFLLRQAGRAQVAAETSQPGWGEPGSLYGLFGGTPPYGDDPNDQDRIKEGYNDRKNGC